MKISDMLNILPDIGLTLTHGDGFCFGEPQADLTGVTVAFTASLDVIAAARSRGDNLLVIHERMFFPTSYSGAKLDRYLTERVNLPRLTALANGDITVLLLRYGPEGPYQRYAAEETLGFPHADAPDALYEVRPQPLRDFSLWVMKRFGTDRARLTGREDRVISRIAILNGGEGITRAPDCMTASLMSGADLIICGETDEYPKWAAQDCGIAMLEVGHTVFDNIGLRRFSQNLAGALGGIRVYFYAIEKPWRVFRAGEGDTDAV
jgi:putative NIF3 family GTP cyclohydrolase 1 type 2